MNHCDRHGIYECPVCNPKQESEVLRCSFPECHSTLATWNRVGRCRTHANAVTPVDVAVSAEVPVNNSWNITRPAWPQRKGQ